MYEAPRRTSLGGADQRLPIEVGLFRTHYRLLTNVHQLEARRYYLAEVVDGRWSTLALERQIHPPDSERGLAP
jgi:hypothetical protein